MDDLDPDSDQLDNIEPDGDSVPVVVQFERLGYRHDPNAIAVSPTVGLRDEWAHPANAATVIGNGY